jgi:hypothetical protein
VTNLIFSRLHFIGNVTSSLTLKNRKPSKDYRLIPLMFPDTGAHNNRWNPKVLAIRTFISSSITVPSPLKLVPRLKQKSNSLRRLYLSMIKSKTSPILPLFSFLISLLLLQMHLQMQCLIQNERLRFQYDYQFTIFKILYYWSK